MSPLAAPGAELDGPVMALEPTTRAAAGNCAENRPEMTGVVEPCLIRK